MVDFPALLADDYIPSDRWGYAQVATRVVRDKYALMAIGSPPSASPSVEISSVVSTSPTTWRVTFSIPVLDNVALRAIVNYVFSPALTVVSITPEAVADPNYVDITTSEQLDGQSYTLTIHLVEAA